ncbi:MAG: TerB N-terminal domain-containing protein [Sporomusaceae bacterium]|jgi:hypothetical protein|nr:TerB N-terminal domain-containing protein [Sporomusaceae bacterium]
MKSLNDLPDKQPVKPLYGEKSLTKTGFLQKNLTSKIFAAIPPNIRELLWFKNGPYANYTPRKIAFKIGNVSIITVSPHEPSLIDVTEPLDARSPLVNALDIGSFPSYTRLTPQQKYTYLNWLTDITKTISTGYLFLFYYGLERHLFFGDMEKAVKIISILRKYHPNISFLVYSADASFLAITKNKRLDLLSYIDFNKSSVSIRLFLRSSTLRQLLSSDILNACTLFDFNDTRAVNSQYELFKNILEQKLEANFNSKYYPVTQADIAAIKSTFAAVVANYSLMPEERFFELPDITSSPNLRLQINQLLRETQEEVKIALKKKGLQ